MIKHETKIVFKSYIGGVRKINVGREFQGNFWWIDVFLLILKTKEMYTFIYIITQLIFLLYHLLSTAWFGILPGWFYYHRKYHMNGKYDLLVLYQHFSSSENKDCFFFKTLNLLYILKLYSHLKVWLNISYKQACLQALGGFSTPWCMQVR